MVQQVTSVAERGAPAAWPFGAAFVERFVEADGFRIRYLEAGAGEPLVYFHGGGGLRTSPALDRLAGQFHVYAFELPGFGASAENTRSASAQDLAATMGRAVAAVGLAQYGLLGTSFGGLVALWLAVQSPEQVAALALEAPAAVRPEGVTVPRVPPSERARLLYAHPERVPASAPPPPEVAEKQRRLGERLLGPARDPDLEARLRELPVPTLIMFGLKDQMLPYTMGRVYKELIPNSHLVLVYDAGHEIGFDRPEAFSGVVADFLRRREAFVVTEASALINP